MSIVISLFSLDVLFAHPLFLSVLLEVCLSCLVVLKGQFFKFFVCFVLCYSCPISVSQYDTVK